MNVALLVMFFVAKPSYPVSRSSLRDVLGHLRPNTFGPRAPEPGSHPTRSFIGPLAGPDVLFPANRK